MYKAIYKNKRFLVITTYNNRFQMYDMGAKWSSKNNCWEMPFNLDSYGRLSNLGAEISNKVHDHFAKMLEGIHNLDGEYASKTKPYEHQRQLTLMALKKHKAFFLCGVGTGKTKAAIDVATTLRVQNKISRCLIICPANIMYNFQEEISIHSEFESVVLSGDLKKRLELQKVECLFHIINYEMIGKVFIDVKGNKNKTYKVNDRFDYDMIIWDECHFLKSRSSERSLNSLRISKNVKYKLGLTGTLIANDPSDAFMPYKIISPQIFGESFTRFKERYLIMGGFDAGYGPTKVVDTNNKSEYQKKLSLNSLRYDLDDVVDLPPIIEVVKKFELSNKTKKIYDKTVDEWIMEYEKEKKVTDNVLERTLRLSQIASGFMPEIDNFETVRDSFIDLSTEKLDLLKDIISDIPKEDKIVICCRFTHSIDRVSELCKKLDYSYYIYDGRQKDKSLYLKYNKDDTKIWIAQIQTGIGYSIPVAKYCFFYETDYSRTHHVQFKGRIRRLKGSGKGSCVYVYLQAKGTIETRVFRTLKNKDFTADDLLADVKGGK